jgi:hypothetical protein
MTRVRQLSDSDSDRNDKLPNARRVVVAKPLRAEPMRARTIRATPAAGAGVIRAAVDEVASLKDICVISLTIVSRWHKADKQEVVFHIPKDTTDEQWCYLSKSLTRALMNVLDLPGAGEMLMGSITSAIYLSNRTDIAIDHLESDRAGLWETDY